MRTRAPVLLPIRSLSRGGGDIDKVYPICVSSEAFLCKAPSACHADITDLLFLIHPKTKPLALVFSGILHPIREGHLGCPTRKRNIHAYMCVTSKWAVGYT